MAKQEGAMASQPARKSDNAIAFEEDADLLEKMRSERRLRRTRAMFVLTAVVTVLVVFLFWHIVTPSSASKIIRALRAFGATIFSVATVVLLFALYAIRIQKESEDRVYGRTSPTDQQEF